MTEHSQKTTFQVGDFARMKKGFEDPDNPDWNIEGWQGRIIEILEEDPRMILIEWDSITLKTMPPAMITQCEEEGRDWTRFYLYATDLEHASPRDRQQDVKAAKSALEDEHAWAYIGEQGKRIQQVLAGVKPGSEMATYRAWEKHLTEELTFPFEAMVSEWQGYGRLREGDRVQVLGISEIVDLYGLIASLRHGRLPCYLPLADLEVADKSSANYQALDDYSVWFANR